MNSFLLCEWKYLSWLVSRLSYYNVYAGCYVGVVGEVFLSITLPGMAQYTIVCS